MLSLAKMNQNSRCPRCRAGKMQRVPRRGWMRRLPESKHYRCEACRTAFLTIWGWAIRLATKAPPEGS